MQLTPDRFADFLAAADWYPRSDDHRQRMRTAFRFIVTRFDRGDLGRPVDRKEHGPGPNGLSIGGLRPVWLSWMQAINYDLAVHVVTINKDRQLINYRMPGDGPGGNWYAEPGTPQSLLALKPTQTAKRNYLVAQPVEILVSTAGDMVVDWGMHPPSGKRPLQGRDYWYRCGGGKQYLVPNAADVLKPV